MGPIDDVRESAAGVLRSAARARREAERSLQDRVAALSRVVLAAVEGLEAVTDAVAGLEDDMPEAVRETVRACSRAAWERLEAAGIVLDGRVGEPVDLTRHRVLKAVESPQAPGRVVAVIAPGVTFGGARIRDAAVWVASEEKRHGADRD